MTATIKKLQQLNAGSSGVSSAALDFVFTQLHDSTTDDASGPQIVVVPCEDGLPLQCGQGGPAPMLTAGRAPAGAHGEIPASEFHPVVEEAAPPGNEPATARPAMDQADSDVSASPDWQSPMSTSSAASIARQILRLRATDAHALFLFVSAGKGDVNYAVTAAVSQAISAQSEQSVLLVDFASSNLAADLFSNETKQYTCLSAEGTIDLSGAQAAALNNLHYLVLNSADLSFRRLTAERASRLAGQLKKHYGLVCLAGGGAESVAARQLARYCDACYLVIDDPNDARLPMLVEFLKRHGARIEGCIAAVQEEPQ